MAAKYKVAMIRHGESDWNPKNLLCGWFDANLTPKGYAEAETAGKTLKAEGFTFDIAHTSLLKRAHGTLNAILKEIGTPDIPVEKTWRLNEKHFGALTGLSKEETSARYGVVQMEIWRRCYDAAPPPMEHSHLYYRTIFKDPRYANELKPEEFPKAESLKMTVERTLPYWFDVIVPQIKEGKSIIISGHGNSLKGIIKHLDNLSEREILNLSVPVGVPFIYELDENLNPVYSMNFLGDEETVLKAMRDAVAQGGI